MDPLYSTNFSAKSVLIL